MSDGYSLRELVKAVARESLPPVALRGVKEVRKLIRSDRPLRVPGTSRVMVQRGREEDTDLFDQIILGRTYDFKQLRRWPEIAAFYQACNSPLILDCGANIGAASIWFATQFPKATVVAVEPEPGNFRVLEENSGAPNMRAVHGAVSSTPGELQIVDPGLGSASFRTEHVHGQAGEHVRAYTLDELAAMVPGSTPFVIKVDIEGAEQDLFDAHQYVLDQCPVVVIELHDWMLPRGRTSQSFLKWHASQDRDFVYIGENVYSLCNRSLPTLAAC
ncbi:MAG: FkbM family methyltransferase [Myxococcaceae bacterium]|nr:FkbM family methyltransferase [Myxococcaceae bacterium]